MSGFKAFKDKIAFLLEDTVEGYRLKLFVIWHSENPRAFTQINKHTLPVYYRSKKSWVTQLLFQNAPLNCCASKWRGTVWRVTYLSRFCLLLIMLPDIVPLLVIFIPISKWYFSLQKVVPAFKSYYLKRTFV